MTTRLIHVSLALLVLAMAGTARSGQGDGGGAGIREGRVRLGDQVEIHYLEAGRETGAAALVLIPGWRLPAAIWQGQMAHFAGSRRVVAIDPRSQGESTKTAEGNTPEVRAQDVDEVMRQLHLSGAVLVGWSQGAQDVAAYVARFGAGAAAGFVLVDSPVSMGPAEVDAHKEFSKAILGQLPVYAAHPREFSQGMMAGIFKKPRDAAYLQRLVEQSLKTPTSIGLAMLVMDIFGADRWAALGKFPRPTLVIATAESRLLEAQREMARLIPGAQLSVIEDAGHAVFVDQPEKFNQALAGFLARLERPASGR
jgi:non-heme chloroperoxidase